MSEFKEIWKTVEGYGERYQVSNFGSIRDTWRSNRLLPQYITPQYTHIVELVEGTNKTMVEVAELLDKYFNVECVIEEEPKRKRKTNKGAN